MKKKLLVIIIVLISLILILFGVYSYFNVDTSNKVDDNTNDKVDNKDNSGDNDNINDSNENISLPVNEGDVIKSFSKKEDVIKAYKDYNLVYDSTDKDGCFIFNGDNNSKYLYCSDEGILRQIDTVTINN